MAATSKKKPAGKKTSAKTSAGKTLVYAAQNSTMYWYRINFDTATLTREGSYELPAGMQYAWPNKARTLLFVITSDAGPMQKIPTGPHYVQVFKFGPAGELVPFKDPVPLYNRPLHVSLDMAEKHVLIAYNNPAEFTVHTINRDGSIGERVLQPPFLDFGITAHQVRVTPDDSIVVFPTRGHHPTKGRKEEPGSIRLFAYKNGKVTKQLPTIEPYDGYEFGARHVDFHPDPAKKWMYALIERQQQLRVYDYTKDSVSTLARYIKYTLDDYPEFRSRQLTSAVHFHPNGKFIYVSNRARDAKVTPDSDGKPVFIGGVNDITVFEVNQKTGEPTYIQHAPTFGHFPRTFGVDPSGRILVAANEEPGWERDKKGNIIRVLPSLVVYRIGADGKLTFSKKYDFADNGGICFWAGVINVPGAK